MSKHISTTPFDILVFTHHLSAYAPKRFEAEASRQGLRLLTLGYDTLDINKLPEARAVIFREPDVNADAYKLRDEVLTHYKNKKATILNQRSYEKWSILDKATQHSEFKSGGIPHIEPSKLADASFPFVAKSRLGSHGDHVFKVESKSDLDRLLVRYKVNDLLIQEFQTAGFDLRVIVLGGSVLGVMKRTPKEGFFLSNYSKGGEATKFIGKDEVERQLIRDLAIKTSKHFHMDFAGVDLILGNNGKWKILEVNRACQFQGFEKAVGLNVAENVFDFMRQGLSIKK